MAKRKSAPRRSRKSTQQKSGLWSWMAILAMTAGGIAAYENRAELFPRIAAVAPKAPSKAQSTSRTAVQPTPKPIARAEEPQKVTRARTERQAPVDALVPPMPIRGPVPPSAISSMVTAAIPANRPYDELNKGVQQTSSTPIHAERQAVASSSQFSFCGRSGLKNCVEDGRIFWSGGKKQVLAGIIVPRTDEAACVEERRKGFAAKVRLRDFLNSGDYTLANGGAGAEISRGGRDFSEQLLRDGLAMPNSTKNRSWCG